MGTTTKLRFSYLDQLTMSLSPIVEGLSQKGAKTDPFGTDPYVSIATIKTGRSRRFCVRTLLERTGVATRSLMITKDSPQ